MKNLVEFKQIVTHPGNSHADEILATALALAAGGHIVPVYRRDPTEDDLENQEILVLDQGGRIDSWANVFDHHQIPHDAPAACTFTILAKELDIDRDLNAFFTWYGTWAEIDAHGPFSWAKMMGVDWSVASTLINPLDDLVHDWWEEAQGNTPVDPILIQRLKALGEKLINSAENSGLFCEEAENRSSWTPINGVDVFNLTWASPEESLLYGESYAKRHGAPGGVIISRDNRGPGFSLFRRNDDPAIDFKRVADDPEVVFAHNGGFIAKTTEGADWRRLVTKAIKPPKAD